MKLVALPDVFKVLNMERIVEFKRAARKFYQESAGEDLPHRIVDEITDQIHHPIYRAELARLYWQQLDGEAEAFRIEGE